MPEEAQALTAVKVEKSGDLYKIVDALNRSLKREGLLFGVALDKEDRNKMVFSVYRT